MFQKNLQIKGKRMKTAEIPQGGEGVLLDSEQLLRSSQNAQNPRLDRLSQSRGNSLKHGGFLFFGHSYSKEKYKRHVLKLLKQTCHR